jgi:DNA-binding transcriptional MerR regulator
MNGWLFLRWVANKAKLAGNTIRKSPSEISYDLIVEDGRWLRFEDDPLKTETFAVAVDMGTAEERVNLAKRIEEERFVQLEPGEFGNEFKGAFVFFKPVWKGKITVIQDDEKGITWKLGKHKIVLIPRPEVPNAWRSYPGTPPGEARFARDNAVAILTNENSSREFRPGTDEKMVFVKEGDTWELRNVPIAAPGIWNGVLVTEELLLTLKRNFDALKETLYVPLKLGHTSKFVENAKYEKTGEPALGWVKNLYWDEEDRVLRADFTKVPRAVVEAIKKGAFTGLSIEIDPDFSGYGDTLVGVALLGADLPAMTSLPRLLAIYQHQGQTYEVLFTQKGGETMQETPEVKNPQATPEPTSLDILKEKFPRAILAFQMEEGEKNSDALVEKLREKGYPTVLAKELLDLLPNPSESTVDLMPNYDRSLWTPRLDTLDKRADLPEKCEDVIKELEEFLEMHGGELNEEEKRRVQDILEKARKNLPHLEVETTENAETEELPEVKAEEVKETEEPSEAEKYPEAGPNVEIVMASKASVVDQISTEVLDMQRKMEEMKEALRQKSLEAIDNKIRAFAAMGIPESVLSDLRTALIELDENLTPNPDRLRLQSILVKLITSRAPSQTFQRLTPPNVESEVSLAEIILQHSRKRRA